MRNERSFMVRINHGTTYWLITVTGQDRAFDKYITVRNKSFYLAWFAVTKFILKEAKQWLER